MKKDDLPAQLIAAATQLADALEQENAALVALDIPRAVKLVEAKADALAALQAILPEIAGARSQATTAAEHRRQAERVSDRLHAQATENKRLLERAIYVQGRIIGMIARAIPRAIAANAPRYGATGAIPAQHLQQPIAVSSRV